MDHDFEQSDELRAAIKAYKHGLNEFAGCIDALLTALGNEETDHRDAYDEASERWQASKKGEAVAAWLDDLSTLVESIEEVNTALDNADVDNLDLKP